MRAVLLLIGIVFLAGCTQSAIENAIRDKYTNINTEVLEGNVFFDVPGSESQILEFKILIKKPDRYVSASYIDGKLNIVDICDKTTVYERHILPDGKEIREQRDTNCASTLSDIFVQTPIKLLVALIENGAKAEEAQVEGNPVYRIKGALTSSDDGSIPVGYVTEDEFIVAKESLELVSWQRKMMKDGIVTQTATLVFKMLGINVPIDDSEFVISKLDAY